MIEIGKQRVVVWKDKKTGEPKSRMIKEKVRRVTRQVYGHSGKKRKLIVTVGGDDLITIKFFNSRRAYSGNVWDIYYQLVNGAAMKVKMDKLRARKLKKAERLARQRLDSAERRFRKRIRSDADALTLPNQANRLMLPNQFNSGAA